MSHLTNSSTFNNCVTKQRTFFSYIQKLCFYSQMIVTFQDTKFKYLVYPLEIFPLKLGGVLIDLTLNSVAHCNTGS